MFPTGNKNIPGRLHIVDGTHCIHVYITLQFLFVDYYQKFPHEQSELLSLVIFKTNMTRFSRVFVI